MDKYAELITFRLEVKNILQPDNINDTEKIAIISKRNC